MKKSQGLNLKQSFRLAFAECRGAWGRLGFFVLCIAVGVGAVAVINTFSVSLQNAVQDESKNLLAADIEIKSSWEQSPEDGKRMNEVLPAGSKIVSLKELHAMARFPDPSKEGEMGSLLAELKAVPLQAPRYPLYGKLETRPGKAIEELLSNNGAVVEASFLERSGLKAGDRFHLGKVELSIRAVVLSEPDRLSRAFSIGPRIFVSLETLKASELIQPGSRVRHKLLIALPKTANLGKTSVLLEQKLKDKSAAIRTYKDRRSSLTDSIERMGRYLGSIAIVALLMGGIGVAMIIHAFMSQKIDATAVMKCLGARSGNIWKIYLIQALLLGTIGSIVGAAGGYAFQYILPAKLSGLLLVEVEPEFYWPPAIRAVLLGLGATLLFCAWPLMQAARINPLRIFRRNFEDASPKGSGKQRALASISFFIGLSLLAYWQAGSFKRAAVFLGALLVSILISGGAALLAIRILKKLPAQKNPGTRYGLANLHRPNNQTLPIVSCLGLGIMLLLTVRLTQMDVLIMLNGNTEASPPNYFFIDIQSDQTALFNDAMSSVAPSAKRELIPLIRSRLYSAGERKIENWKYKNRAQEEWFINREFVLTFSDENEPPKGNRVVKGSWWGAKGSEKAQVSLEEDAARRLGLDIGSMLTVDIQGIHVSAEVANIRKVDWRNMRTNFYIIFSSSALEGAPVTYVATAHVPAEKEIEVRRAVVNKLPNVTALSSSDIIKTVKNITEKLAGLVDFMSGFSILSGLIILSGSIASTKYRRMKETAVLKILGARRGAVIRILSTEYAVLGILAGLAGGGLSILLSWTVMKYLVKAPWHFHPLAVLSAVGISVIAVVITGILSSLDSIKNRPGKTIRQII